MKIPFKTIAAAVAFARTPQGKKLIKVASKHLNTPAKRKQAMDLLSKASKASKGAKRH